MISMQQLEELENRVVRALQLISDLRTENAKLENDNEELRGDLEEAKLSLEEKEQEISRIRRELDDATRELQELTAKEEALEKKVVALLGKLDEMSPGGAVPQGDRRRREAPASQVREQPRPKPAPVEEDIILDDFKEEELRVDSEGRKRGEAREDDDIIIIDDESDLKSGKAEGVALETVSEADEDIILLDEGDEEIIIDDVERDRVIIDEEEVPKARAKDKKPTSSKPASPKEDDEFLIIEEDEG